METVNVNNISELKESLNNSSIESIYLNPGNYYLDQPIEIGDNSKIIGINHKSTFIWKSDFEKEIISKYKSLYPDYIMSKRL